MVLLITAGDHEPTTPVGDVADNVGATLPEQNGAKALNPGLLFATIVIVTIVGLIVAHWPEFGVNVYTVEPNKAVFTVAGVQFPDIEGVLLEFKGKIGAVAF